MIGKKRQKDIQFVREATEGLEETSNRKRRYGYGDEDELEQEQAERQRRKALDKEFKAFAQEIHYAVSEYFLSQNRMKLNPL